VPYAIAIFPQAMADIRAAVTWRGQRSSFAAGRMHAGLLAAVRRLANNPERCPLANEAADLSLDLRELLCGRQRRRSNGIFPGSLSVV
jgi:hypothetical protein